MDLSSYFGNDDPDYLAWGLKLEALIVDKTGLGILDYPDQEYYAWYEEGLTAEEACDQLMEVLTEEWDWEF